MDNGSQYQRTAERVRAFRVAVEAYAARGGSRTIERIDVDRRGGLSALSAAQENGTRELIGLEPLANGADEIRAFPPERDPKLFGKRSASEVLSDHVQLAEPRWVAGYRPLKRVVFAVGEAGSRLYCRVKRRRTRSAALAIASRSGAFPSLQRVATIGKLTIETWEAAPGTSLHALMAEDADWASYVHLVGRAVARVGRVSTPAPEANAAAVDRPIADAMHARAKLALVAPGLLSACDRLVRRAIEDVRGFGPFIPICAHGDLHERQIFIDHGRCWLIDPDAARVAPLEWDVANLAAHFVLNTEMDTAMNHQRAEQALIESFRDALPRSLADCFSMQRFHALERLAVARLIGVHGCRPTTRARVPGLVRWLHQHVRSADRAGARSRTSTTSARQGRSRRGMIFAALLAASLGTMVSTPGAATSVRLREGLWVEVQGEHRPDHRFKADELEVKRHTSSRRPEIHGEVDAIDDERREIEIVGIRVRLDENDLSRLRAGDRVELELRSDRPDGVAVATRVTRLDPDEETEIEGWLEDLSSDGLRFTVNGISIRLSSDVEIDADGGVAALLAPPIEEVFEKSRSDDDWQPEGQTFMHPNVRVGGRVSARVESQSGFDLDAAQQDEFLSRTMDARAHLRWDPSPWVVAYAEARGSGRRTRDEGVVADVNDRTRWRFGPTYVAARAPVFPYVALQAGRIDMEDDREWFYDQNLDGIRLHLLTWGPTAELGFYRTEVTPSSDVRDETYTIGKVSFAPAADVRPQLYFVRRHDRRESTNTRDWIGGRLASKHRHVKTWIDYVRASGDYRGVELDAWAVDMGAVLRTRDPLRASLYASLARGSGDAERGDSVDHEFRDTGLSDYTDAMDGLKSFDYYGELTDPELSNLRVTTFGAGAYATTWLSVDVLHHSYRQESLRDRFRSQVPIDPTGLSRDIGRELDIVVGLRAERLPLDVELVWARFSPGEAFDRRDTATTFKVEMEWRR